MNLLGLGSRLTGEVLKNAAEDRHYNLLSPPMAGHFTVDRPAASGWVG